MPWLGSNETQDQRRKLSGAGDGALRFHFILHPCRQSDQRATYSAAMPPNRNSKVKNTSLPNSMSGSFWVRREDRCIRRLIEDWQGVPGAVAVLYRLSLIPAIIVFRLAQRLRL